jgi:hypothetical protein
MALLKNWQSLLSAAVGCAGDAGAHHIEAVEGGFGRFFALLQSFGRSFHARRRIVSYSEENRTKTFTLNIFVRSGAETLQARIRTSTQQISDQSALI